MGEMLSIEIPFLVLSGRPGEGHVEPQKFTGQELRRFIRRERPVRQKIDCLGSSGISEDGTPGFERWMRALFAEIAQHRQRSLSRRFSEYQHRGMTALEHLDILHLENAVRRSNLEHSREVGEYVPRHRLRDRGALRTRAS